MRVDLPKKVMISVRGTYKDGVVEVDKPLKLSRTDGEVKVIVTFLEEDQVEPRRLTKEDFSFARSRESSKRYQGNLSDAVIEERTSEPVS